MAKIIIIDDEAPILELMGQVCRRMGHTVSLHLTGQAGMAAMEKEKPELLIVDLRIPDMNGLQIIQDCRARYPMTAGITAFLCHPSFPVDIRHNAKIFR